MTKARTTAPAASIVFDYYVIYFDARAYATRAGISLSTIATTLGVVPGVFAQWARRGFLPSRVYYAMAMAYEPNYGALVADQSALIVERVKRTPFRLASPLLNRLAEDWELKHMRSPLRPAVLQQLEPRKSALVTTDGTTYPESGALPIVHYAAKLTPAPAPAVATPVIGAATPVAPHFSATPRPTEVTSDHAGMQQLVQLLSKLKTERDHFKSERDHFKAQSAAYQSEVLERNLEITSLKAQIEQYEKDLSEALRLLNAPKAPTPTDQVAEAREVMRAVDPSLLAELETLNRPS